MSLEYQVKRNEFKCFSEILNTQTYTSHSYFFDANCISWLKTVFWLYVFIHNLQAAKKREQGPNCRSFRPSNLFFTSILGSIWAIFSRIYLDVGLVLLTISANVDVYTASVIKAALFKFNLHYLYIQGDTNTIHFR